MKRSRFSPILGIVAGAAAIVFAVCIFVAKPAAPEEIDIPAVPSVYMTEMDTGTRTSYSYYGGDAYTGIQQAGADTARNVVSLAKISNKGFEVTAQALNNVSSTVRNSALTVIRELRGSSPDNRLPFCAILLVMGLGMIVFSLRSLNEIKARESYEAGILDALKQLGARVIPSGSEDVIPESGDARADETPAEDPE